MPLLLSGGYLRVVLACARRARLSAGPRGSHGGPGCARDNPAGSGLLRGELDRFGGISVRMAQLDSLDADSFQRGLQGKCAWAEGLLGRGTPGPLMK